VNWQKACQEHRNSYKGAKTAKKQEIKKTTKGAQTEKKKNRAAKENQHS
jgi:hypothetical protein